jgi:hypothetical protein
MAPEPTGKKQANDEEKNSYVAACAGYGARLILLSTNNWNRAIR